MAGGAGQAVQFLPCNHHAEGHAVTTQCRYLAELQLNSLTQHPSHYPKTRDTYSLNLHDKRSFLTFRALAFLLVAQWVFLSRSPASESPSKPKEPPPWEVSPPLTTEAPESTVPWIKLWVSVPHLLLCPALCHTIVPPSFVRRRVFPSPDLGLGRVIYFG